MYLLHSRNTTKLLGLFMFCFYNLHLSSSVCALKYLGERCNFDQQCETNLCHKSRKECACHSFIDFSIGQKREQLYRDGRCYSKVDQVCTKWNPYTRQRVVITCIANAVCQSTLKEPKDYYGKCGCGAFFVPTANGTQCVLATRLVFVRSPAQRAPDPIITELWPDENGNIVTFNSSRNANEEPVVITPETQTLAGNPDTKATTTNVIDIYNKGVFRFAKFVSSLLRKKIN